jgi:hypothetical protein
MYTFMTWAAAAAAASALAGAGRTRSAGLSSVAANASACASAPATAAARSRSLMGLLEKAAAMETAAAVAVVHMMCGRYAGKNRAEGALPLHYGEGERGSRGKVNEGAEGRWHLSAACV